MLTSKGEDAREKLLGILRDWAPKDPEEKTDEDLDCTDVTGFDLPALSAQSYWDLNM